MAGPPGLLSAATATMQLQRNSNVPMVFISEPPKQLEILWVWTKVGRASEAGFAPDHAGDLPSLGDGLVQPETGTRS